MAASLKADRLLMGAMALVRFSARDCEVMGALHGARVGRSCGSLHYSPTGPVLRRNGEIWSYAAWVLH